MGRRVSVDEYVFSPFEEDCENLLMEMREYLDLCEYRPTGDHYESLDFQLNDRQRERLSALLEEMPVNRWTERFHFILRTAIVSGTVAAFPDIDWLYDLFQKLDREAAAVAIDNAVDAARKE